MDRGFGGGRPGWSRGWSLPAFDPQKTMARKRTCWTTAPAWSVLSAEAMMHGP